MCEPFLLYSLCAWIPPTSVRSHVGKLGFITPGHQTQSARCPKGWREPITVVSALLGWLGLATCNRDGKNQLPGSKVLNHHRCWINRVILLILVTKVLPPSKEQSEAVYFFLCLSFSFKFAIPSTGTVTPFFYFLSPVFLSCWMINQQFFASWSFSFSLSFKQPISSYKTALYFIIPLFHLSLRLL